MNPLSLALQPPSLHGLPSHSRSPFAACTRSRSRSPSVSTTFAPSSHSLLHRHLAPHSPGTKAASDANSAPASMVSQRRTRLSRCTSVSSNLSLLAVQPPYDVSAALSRPDTCSQSDASNALWKAYSRVRMTIAETHTHNPLDTMSEYWHALSASRPQEQEQTHKGEEEEEASSASCTTMELTIDAAIHEPSSFAPFCVSSAETSTSASLPGPSANGGMSTGVMLGNESPPSVVPVSTAGSVSPSQLSSSCNQDTAPSSMAAAPYALVTSSFQSVRSSATEQGRLLAQRSRTSLNRFLDSVLDNATTVAESNTAHESYSEHGSTASQTKTYASDMKSTRPQLQQQPTSKLKFFVCDESEDDNDDDDDDESEDGRLAVMAIRRSKPATNLIRQADAHDFHYKDYDSQDCEAEDSQDEEGDSFCGHMFIATPTSQTPRSGVFSHHRHASPPAALERRQSLLSDLLQAEREQRRQKDLSLCDYLTNLDGEPQIDYPAHHHHHHYHHHHHQQQQHLERNCPSRGQTTQQQELTTKPHSPLLRTRKIYNNLDGLALVATASAFTTTPTAVSPAASPMSSVTAPTEATLTAPARGTTITKAAPVAGWSRSHVQVQIQSLVVQSTSTAQRALLNASSTLTDVLFRAAK